MHASNADGSVTERSLHSIRFDAEAITELCFRWHILRLRVYGSILREDFHAESDIDMIVDFEPGHTPGFGFIGVQEELGAVLGREVDLTTPKGLSKYIRERVLSEAKDIYVR
jgi:predicted nucleotidyltransferase